MPPVGTTIWNWLDQNRQSLRQPPNEWFPSWGSIPAIKYAMDLNGYYGGLPRLPPLPGLRRRSQKSKA
jgi:hypothetical protein